MTWGKRPMAVGQKAHGHGAKGPCAFCPCASCPTVCKHQHHFLVKSFIIEMRHTHNGSVPLKYMQHISCGMSPLSTHNWMTVCESFKNILRIKCQNFDDAQLELICQLVISYHSKMLSISKCGSITEYNSPVWKLMKLQPWVPLPHRCFLPHPTLQSSFVEPLHCLASFCRQSSKS